MYFYTVFSTKSNHLKKKFQNVQDVQCSSLFPKWSHASIASFAPRFLLAEGDERRTVPDVPRRDVMRRDVKDHKEETLTLKVNDSDAIDQLEPTLISSY